MVMILAVLVFTEGERDSVAHTLTVELSSDVGIAVGTDTVASGRICRDDNSKTQYQHA